MENRISRALTQRLYLIKNTVINKNQHNFIVMGSTGNAYTVSIKQVPTCSCPDNKIRHQSCKHIYFVLMRVLKHTNINNKKFTDDDLEKLFNNLDISKEVTVDDSIVKEYDEKLQESNNETTKPKDKDDVCPICFDELDDGGDLDYCKYSCGKYVHVECFKMWTSKNAATCVFCRHVWNKIDGEYINLTKK